VAEVTIYINGRSYDIACDDGQEGRIVDLAAYIDQRLQQISRGGAAYNDAHLNVLTSLVLADELFETREQLNAVPRTPRAAAPAASPVVNKEEEAAVMKVLEQLTKRIEGVATRVAQAS
jgi:cell division protein ZapA